MNPRYTDDNDVRALERDLQPHPGEDGWTYAARLLREQERQRRSRRVFATVRVGAAITLAVFGISGIF